ncbi:MAG: hypothetical protein ABSC01_07850 [Verrucomicrobiota bacterium]|jgi:ATP-dependent Clp protease ATP-binding subunit ClpB
MKGKTAFTLIELLVVGKVKQAIQRRCDPQFGARPLKRVVQEQLLNPLSMRLLEGDFKPGDKIKVTAKGDELVFDKK